MKRIMVLLLSVFLLSGCAATQRMMQKTGIGDGKINLDHRDVQDVYKMIKALKVDPCSVSIADAMGILIQDQEVKSEALTIEEIREVLKLLKELEDFKKQLQLDGGQ